MKNTDETVAGPPIAKPVVGYIFDIAATGVPADAWLKLNDGKWAQIEGATVNSVLIVMSTLSSGGSLNAYLDPTEKKVIALRPVRG